jgi:hypothetical protein
MTHYVKRAGRVLGTTEIPELTTLTTDLDAAEVAITALQAFDTSLQAAWTSYTPAITAGSGTITTASATGKYKTVGKTTFITMTITITTNGSGATSVIATLPNTCANNTVLVGRSVALGAQVMGIIGAGETTVTLFNYNDSYPGASGGVLFASGVYENT